MVSRKKGEHLVSKDEIEYYEYDKLSFPFLSFPFLCGIFVGYIPSANSANTYSYLWGTTGSASGNISYSGTAIENITATIGNLYTGTMSVKYVDCSTTNKVYVYYAAKDRWIFIPNSINVEGISVPVTVNTLPSEYEIINSDYNGFILLKNNGSTYSNRVSGGCGTVGGTYPINYTYPSFSLNVNISDLTSGSYTGTIPVRMAYAEYFGVYSSDITKFSDDLAFQYTSISEIPYSINIINKCVVLPTEIELSHGELSAGVANGHSVSSNMTITCDEPASLKLTVTSRSNPETLYYDGVGVGLGNGWDSVLQIGNSGLSDYSLTDKTILVSGGNVSIPVTSTLKRTGTVSAGNISGNMVLSMEMD